MHAVGIDAAGVADAHGVADFDAGRILAGLVEHGTRFGFVAQVGGVTDVVARQRHADGRTHAHRAHAHGGGDASHQGLDLAVADGVDVDFAGAVHRAALDAGGHAAEDDVVRIGTRTGHAHAHQAAGDGHRGRHGQRPDLRAARGADRHRAGTQAVVGRAADGTGRQAVHRADHRFGVAGDGVARQGDADGQGHAHLAEAGGQGHRRRNGVDARQVLGRHFHAAGLDAGTAVAVDHGRHVDTDLVLGEHARAGHADAHGPGAHGGRAGHDDGHDVLRGQGLHAQRVGAQHLGVDQAGADGQRRLAAGARAPADEVLRHRDADGRTDAHGTPAHGQRGGHHHRADAGLAAGADGDVLCAVQHAAADQGRGAAQDDVLRHRAGAGHGDAHLAEAHRQRGGRRHGADGALGDGELAAGGAGQDQRQAVGRDDRPALALFEHADAQRVHALPAAGIGVVLGVQRDICARGADVAVDGADDAAGAMAVADAHADAGLQVLYAVGRFVGGGGGHAAAVGQGRPTAGAQLRIELVAQRVQHGAVGQRVLLGFVDGRSVGVVLGLLGGAVQAEGGQRACGREVEELAAFGQRADLDAAAVGCGGLHAAVGVEDLRVGVDVHLVEGQRQADGHADAHGAEGRSHRGRGGHGADARAVLGQHGHAAAADAGAAVAVDRGVDVAADLVLGVGAGAADGHAHLAGGDAQGCGHDHGVDGGLVVGLHRDAGLGPHAAVQHRRAHRGAGVVGADQLPQVGVAVLLGAQVEALAAVGVGVGVGDGVAQVFVDLAGEGALGLLHAQAVGQRVDGSGAGVVVDVGFRAFVGAVPFGLRHQGPACGVAEVFAAQTDVVLRAAQVAVDVARAFALAHQHTLAGAQRGHDGVALGRGHVMAHAFGAIGVVADEVARHGHADGHGHAHLAGGHGQGEGADGGVDFRGADRQHLDLAHTQVLATAGAVVGTPDHAALDQGLRVGEDDVGGHRRPAGHAHADARTHGQGHGRSHGSALDVGLVLGPHHHVAAAGAHRRHVADAGQRVFLDAVLRQRQADGHRDGGLAGGAGDGRRGRQGDGVDAGIVDRLHAQRAAAGDGGGAAGAAVAHRGFDDVVDGVEGERADGAHGHGCGLAADGHGQAHAEGQGIDLGGAQRLHRDGVGGLERAVLHQGARGVADLVDGHRHAQRHGHGALLPEGQRQRGGAGDGVDV